MNGIDRPGTRHVPSICVPNHRRRESMDTKNVVKNFNRIPTSEPFDRIDHFIETVRSGLKRKKIVARMERESASESNAFHLVRCIFREIRFLPTTQSYILVRKHNLLTYSEAVLSNRSSARHLDSETPRLSDEDSLIQKAGVHFV